MKVLDLFSGIGGFSLGLERAGMKTVAFCEIEPYCQKVLQKHWPDVPIYDDIRELTNDRLKTDGITGIDVITGGFPCQDISGAGKQAGIKGERSGLWAELCRIIGEVRPRFAVMENVPNLISGDRGRWFGAILGDLASIGYDCEWHCIPASELGAHHHRDRVWIVAYPSSDGIWQQSGWRCGSSRKGSALTGDNGAQESMANTNSQRLQGERPNDNQKGREKPLIRPARLCHRANIGREWEVEPGLGRVANGIPRRVDRIKGLGNAVVPQIPELIGRALMDAEA